MWGGKEKWMFDVILIVFTSMLLWHLKLLNATELERSRIENLMGSPLGTSRKTNCGPKLITSRRCISITPFHLGISHHVGQHFWYRCVYLSFLELFQKTRCRTKKNEWQKSITRPKRINNEWINNNHLTPVVFVWRQFYNAVSFSISFKIHSSFRSCCGISLIGILSNVFWNNCNPTQYCSTYTVYGKLK